MPNRLLLILLFTAPAFCQPFSAGVKGGVPLTDAFNIVQNQNYQFSPTTSRYIAGVTAELHFPFGLGLEVDALYRHMSYTSTALFQGIAAAANVNSGDWEFPVLVKYRFHGKIARPFIDAGVAWNRLSGLSASVTQSISSGTVTVVNKNSSVGFVAGVGLDLHFVVHILPEIRYTHWGSAQIVDPTTLLKNNQSQAEFLLGITF